LTRDKYLLQIARKIIFNYIWLVFTNFAQRITFPVQFPVTVR